MKDFKRQDTLFSLCGLNCALCSMRIGGYCPGCGGGPGNQPCAIARCSASHGGFEYCHECSEYPCEKYNGIDRFDSFITHRNQLKDMEKMKNMGKSAYLSELNEKSIILQKLLLDYNDGRKKSLFCIAANLLELSDLNAVMEKLEDETKGDLSLKEKAAVASNLFLSMAEQRGIILKLIKK